MIITLRRESIMLLFGRVVQAPAVDIKELLGKTGGRATRRNILQTIIYQRGILLRQGM